MMTEESRPQDELAIPLEPLADGIAEEPLEICEFVQESADESRRIGPSQPRNIRNDGPVCWYCGVAEAIGWFMGTLFVHVVGGVSMLIGLMILTVVFTGKAPGNMQDPQLMFTVTAGEMLIFVLASILAISIRYWGRTFDELNFHRPDWRHVAIVILGTLPLSFLVSAWSIPIQMGWQSLIETFPVLKILDALNSMELVKDMARTTSLPVMIFVVAVLPAIGEELVFRGAIGRVLIANLGIWGGMLLTSFLFGWIHIHPVHALAVMPLGLAIHLIYLSTRSFWLPMLLHFLNNAWAVFSSQSNAVDPINDGLHMTFLESMEIATGTVAVIALGITLWQSRVRYFQDDGHEWHSGRFPIRVPSSSGVHRQCAPVNSICWGIAMASAIVCHLLVAIDLMGPIILVD